MIYAQSSMYIRNIYVDGGLDENSTCKEFLQVKKYKEVDIEGAKVDIENKKVDI